MQVCVLVAVVGCVVSGILAQNPSAPPSTITSSVALPGVGPSAPPSTATYPQPRPPGSPSVGFSVRKAVVGRSYTISASPYNLQFQDVLSNYGGGWRTYSHDFIAPVSGVYKFEFNALSSSNSDFTMALIKNGIYQAGAYASAGHQWGGNSGYLTLSRGDRVSLVLYKGEIFEHHFKELFTTFSGFLVSVT